MANSIKSLLISSGFVGERLDDFCLMIGQGSVASLVGLSFQTIDTGLTPGAGVGTGTGILGVLEPIVFANIMSNMSSYSGEKLSIVVNAISHGLVTELSNATLTSTHTPVHTGTGIIVLGSIMPIGSVWGNNIFLQGTSLGFTGEELYNFSHAIGSGCAMSFTTATGQVTIGGSGGNVPGSGTGVGVIS